MRFARHAFPEALECDAEGRHAQLWRGRACGRVACRAWRLAWASRSSLASTPIRPLQLASAGGAALGECVTWRSAMWVQERLRAGSFTLHKVAGDENPADILTKVVARTLLDRHLGRMAMLREAGRASSAPLVAAQVDQRLAGMVQSGP